MPAPFLRIVVGATASGKERLALACAGATGAEIVSVDSMKIYRGLDIGTAKPGAAERAAVPHHCLDLAEPTESFSAGRFAEAAEKAIMDIAGRGKPVILSGGSALYFKALLEGLFPGPGADAALRAGLEARAASEGVKALHAELSARDPEAAGKIHPADLRRVVRALEVVELTGRPISRHQTQWAGFHGSRENAAPAYRFPFSMIRLTWPRGLLRERIAVRAGRLLASGLLEEARRVFERRRELARTPLQAVGYKEFFPYFEGTASLDQAAERLRAGTGRLAKSQDTWFRKFPCRELAADGFSSPEALRDAALELFGE